MAMPVGSCLGCVADFSLRQQIQYAETLEKKVFVLVEFCSLVENELRLMHETMQRCMATFGCNPSDHASMLVPVSAKQDVSSPSYSESQWMGLVSSSASSSQDTPNDALDFAVTRHNLKIPEDIPAKVNLTNLVSFAIGELKQRIDIEKVSTALTSLECKQEGDVDTETEEGVRRRHEKRHEIIGCILQKPAYKSYLEMLKNNEELPCVVPDIPDASDVTISKRKWEALVSQWRGALRTCYEFRHGKPDDAISFHDL